MKTKKKKMHTEEIRKAMIEIILGKQPSSLKIMYPEHYDKLRNQIIDMHSSGQWVSIPF